MHVLAQFEAGNIIDNPVFETLYPSNGLPYAYSAFIFQRGIYPSLSYIKIKLIGLRTLSETMKE